MRNEIEELGILRGYVYPSLVLFVVPLFSLAFFNSAQRKFDRELLASIEQAITDMPDATAAEREAARIFYRTHPVSELLASDAPEFAEARGQFDADTRFYYATFRWMIRIALLCVGSGVLVYVGCGVSVLWSLRSPRAQYYSLAAGWNVLRIFSTLQVVAQAILLVGLSFWVTALWFNFYSVQLMGVVGLAAAGGVLAVVRAIFRPLSRQTEVPGELLERTQAERFWSELEALSARIGTAPPAQIVAGIDANFFVTEAPIKVGEQRLRGRTLYVSLSLLKLLNAQEAAAVISHELAHFSGNDTYYGRKIGPLLERYENYLAGLHDAWLARPVFSCAVAFRALYQISLSRLNKQRELRADRIAVEQTSPRDQAAALLKVVAYSTYRSEVEDELFHTQAVHQVVNISERLEQGFPEFAQRFADTHDVMGLVAAHPFDSHPPLGTRLAEIGVEATPEVMREVFASPPDRVWFERIDDAQTREQSLWAEYEAQFRDFHEQTLVYRYLPETDEEREFVERHFPPVALPLGKEREVVFDCEKITYAQWAEPIYYREIVNVAAQKEWGQPRLTFQVGTRSFDLPLSKREKEQQAVFQTLQNYSSRYATASAYHAERAAANGTGGDGDPGSVGEEPGGQATAKDLPSE